jgi:hypothetical protein
VVQLIHHMTAADVKPTVQRRERGILRRKRTANRLPTPDGFPHRSIGLAAFVAIVLAGLLIAALARGSMGLVIALVAFVPIAIVLITLNARRQRRNRASMAQG